MPMYIWNLEKWYFCGERIDADVEYGLVEP